MVPTDASISWQDYLAIVVRRRWFFTIPCVSIVVIALVVGLFLPRIFRAETIILVQEPKTMNPLMKGLAMSSSMRDRLPALREEIVSWTSLSRLVHELQFAPRLKSPVRFEGMIKQLQKDIAVQMHGADLLRISYEHEDPQLAQRLVNTLSTIFLERSIEAQSAETDTALTFIEQELAVYKKQLEDSEGALREFQELYTTQMPVATQLNDQIVIREVELANLLIENTPEHPEVVELKRRIQELKDQRNAELKRFIASAIAKGRDPALYEDLVRTLDDASAEAGALASSDGRRAREAYAAWVTQMDHPLIAAQELTSPPMPLLQVNGEAPGVGLPMAGASNATLVSLAPLQGQELARLNRDYKVNAATYQNLQQRYEQARITQRLGKSDEGLKFRILEPARLPLKPIKPNLLHLFVLSLLLGAVVGVGVAFIAEYVDQSFQSAEDVQAALAVPVLGSISTIVTAQDVEAWRARRRTWCSATHQWQSLRLRVFAPLRTYCGGRLDALLVRWKL